VVSQFCLATELRHELYVHVIASSTCCKSAMAPPFPLSNGVCSVHFLSQVINSPRPALKLIGGSSMNIESLRPSEEGCIPATD
jgi:hypothetical protein